VEAEKELISRYESPILTTIMDDGAHINTDIIDYLLKETENIPVFNKIIIHVAFPSLTMDKLNVLKALINEHIGMEISYIKSRKKRRVIFALIIAMIGSFFLSTKIIFPDFFTKNSLNDISVIAGWVFLWRAIELLFFFHPDNHIRKLKLLHLFSAEYKMSE
jgi:uncharacterized membrane protein YpjA